MADSSAAPKKGFQLPMITGGKAFHVPAVLDCFVPRKKALVPHHSIKTRRKEPVTKDPKTWFNGVKPQDEDKKAKPKNKKKGKDETGERVTIERWERN